MSKTKTRAGLKYPDLALFAFLVIFIGFVVYRVSYSLEYRWDWGVIRQYLFRFDADKGGYVPGILVKGLAATVRLSIWSGIIATVLGFLFGVSRVYGNFFLKKISYIYVQTVRNIPSIVFVFIFYFFFSSQVLAWFGIDEAMSDLSPVSEEIVQMLFCKPSLFTAFLSAILTLGIYEGAYMTEIFRAGIESVDRGQWEASDSLGFSMFQQMRYIILPQALRRILPAIAGQIISIIKDSAIVSVISVQELTFQGMELMASTYRTFEVWIIIMVMYFGLTYTCSFFIGKLNERMDRKGYQR